MPISQSHRFECSECGYTEVRIVGDRLPDKEMLKPCPKCEGMMLPKLDEDDKLEKIVTMSNKILNE